VSDDIKVICSECKKVLKHVPDANVSHGYCKPCAIKFLWLEGVSQEELTEFAKEVQS